jgi:hypothetical protein
MPAKARTKTYAFDLDFFNVSSHWIRVSVLSRGTGEPRRDVLCGELQGHRSEDWKVEPTEGQGIAGTLRFATDDDGRTAVEIRLTGARPDRRYRFTLHEWEDCSHPAHGSMGDPYSPERQAVSYPNYKWPLKQGALGTFKARSDGTVLGRTVYSYPMSAGGPATVWGRSVVVWELPTSQSGSIAPFPVACARVDD